MYVKRTTHAIQRCKSQQRRWSYGREQVGRRYGDACDFSLLADLGKGDVQGGWRPGRGVCVYVKPWVEGSTPGARPLRVTGGFWVEALSESRSRICVVLRVDPGLKMVPRSVVDWVVRRVAHKLVPTLGEAAKRFEPGGVRRERIDESPELYGEIEKRLKALKEGPPPAAVGDGFPVFSASGPARLPRHLVVLAVIGFLLGWTGMKLHLKRRNVRALARPAAAAPLSNAPAAPETTAIAPPPDPPRSYRPRLPRPGRRRKGG